LIETIARAARAAGWAASHVHSEQFTAPPVGEPFDVYLARSRLTVHVPPGQSLLEAVEAAGVDAPYLCRGGACGQCETDVLELEGELVHNDDWLSNEEKAGGRKIMPCVSRARCTRLVLDR
jgi:ferredoxin